MTRMPRRPLGLLSAWGCGQPLSLLPGTASSLQGTHCYTCPPLPLFFQGLLRLRPLPTLPPAHPAHLSHE